MFQNLARVSLKTYILRQGTEELGKVEGILYARDFQIVLAGIGRAKLQWRFW
jgi:hypothetical protein